MKSFSKTIYVLAYLNRSYLLFIIALHKNMCADKAIRLKTRSCYI